MRTGRLIDFCATWQLEIYTMSSVNKRVHISQNDLIKISIFTRFSYPRPFESERLHVKSRTVFDERKKCRLIISEMMCRVKNSEQSLSSRDDLQIAFRSGKIEQAFDFFHRGRSRVSARHEVARSVERRASKGLGDEM